MPTKTRDKAMKTYQKSNKGKKVVVRTPKKSSGVVDKLLKSTISVSGPRPKKTRGMPHPIPKGKKR